MSKLTDIYSRLTSELSIDNLPEEERNLIKANEGYIQAMLYEITRSCQRYIKMGVEFDINLRFTSKEDGSLHTEYHNNLVNN